MSNDRELLDPAEPTHPRFRARRAEVAVESLRSRNRKLLIVGALVAIVLLALASTQSALLDVDEVRIVGAERTAPETLREVAGIDLGVSLFRLDTDDAVERLTELPAIESVTASKNWRGVVTFEVVERTPTAWIAAANGIAVIADDGIVITLVPAPVVGSERPLDEGDEGGEGELAEPPPATIGLPEISGAMFSIDVGETVPTVLVEALEVANQLPPDIDGITERVEITVDSLVLRVVGGGAISLGDARDLDDKFDAVRAFLAQVDLSCLDTLNVRAPTVPVIVRNPSC